MRISLPFFLAALLLLVGCKPDAAVPAQSTPIAEPVALFPDYRDIVIPPNIAPLNFQAKNQGTAFVVELKGQRGEALLAAAGQDGVLQLDTTAWRALLTDNRGSDLVVTLYAERESGWVRHPAYKLTVAPEPIDPYLSYRLIEPSYELYRQLGLYQRDLTTFDETAIYENNDHYEEDNNHCVNCHNYQNYDTDRMLFHVRADHGGTVFVEGDKVRKMDMKADSVMANSVYPTWHPQKPWVVFSSNFTGQAFHMLDKQKVEVVDYGSDLVFYDVERNKLSNILRSTDKLETFPAWSPDGSRLYYCVADFPLYDQLPDSVKLEKGRLSDIILGQYDKVRYSLYSLPFDEKTRTFGTPQVEMDCAAEGKSASFPRVSPDGRYVLFALADYGQFHIWHKSSDLYIKDVQTGDIRPLKQANSHDVDSYHTWSSNGRWMVFSSRRDDGSYTRPYIAYFDKNGRDHKAFLLPQEHPHHHLDRTRSYNVPELTRSKVKVSPEDFRRVVYDDAATQKVEYGK